jgi:protein-tyrosine phosphatase
VIDTHCHLLHGVDDGPSSPDLAVALAHELVEAGVHSVVCTPHYSRRYRTDRAVAQERLEELRRRLGDAGLPLLLSLAAEVSAAFAVSEPFSELASRTIGSFLLVELEPNTPAAVLETVLDRLERRRLRPIFAHPERCTGVREQPRLLAEARAGGALVQVVAPSLTGSWGAAVGAAGWQLLESGLVDLLASDSHRPARDGRANLRAAAEAVADRYGADTLAELTERAPARVLHGVPDA